MLIAGVTAIGAIGTSMVALLAVGWVFYQRWLKKGIKPYIFVTRVPHQKLRSLFEEKIARQGWTIVDDGNPIVAQSSLLTGTRQQIRLAVDPDEASGVSSVELSPQHWGKNRVGIPTKGPTLRLRMKSYIQSVQAIDPMVQPTRTVLPPQ